MSHHLAQGLALLYVVHGEALLLAIEAADAIRAAARTAGYTEREVLIAEPGFKWAELRNSAQSLSLFSTRKLVDLRIPSGKPGVEGAQALQDYCQKLNADTVTLVSLPRLDKTTLTSKWFTALSAQGVIIASEEIVLSALPAWIASRLKRQNQSAEMDTLVFLAERVEGNLLAAYQEIQKLALLFPAGPLSFEQVKDSVMDVARYDVFKLSEAMLAGDVARYAHILDGLRAEGTAAVLILWALAEDIRTLSKVLRAMQYSGNLSSALRDARVWGARQKFVERAVRRFTPAIAERALRQAAHVDKVVKGLRRGNVWDELLQLGVRCANVKAA
ncbi:DNA polymerase III subunit delta [Candidatus Nitrotoga sp. HW29]|uniref:DNA polymerase III subunit delta n=1 Tax=Candidatus Nitrotoga sp. HW29 TaxID=2886963 RepID=UPI002A4E2C1D|nr:DNA polymerase III subunit delta [Candidatus Nitrotoga sp. HW29]